MNKRTRLIVSLLFVVLIILAVAITRFYVNAGNDPAVNGGNESIEKILDTNEGGYSIFSDSSGSCGISESGRILAAPEWESIEFAGDSICIASKKTGGTVRYGCIDFDGNVTVPLIYSGIEKQRAGGQVFYCAASIEDDSIVVYDSSFVPCFGKSWKSCHFSEDELLLSDERGRFTYNISENGLLFRSANLTGEIKERPYELNIYSRVLLSKLTPGMIEKMAEFTESYMAYAFDGDEAPFKEAGVDLRQFKKVFPNSEEIIQKRLKAIPEIHIYNVGSEDGTSAFDVFVSADAEILYTAENGKKESLTTCVKAYVRFRGNYETGLEAVSGSIEPQAPEYPQEETTSEDTTQVN
ncbi:MAG: hypothetical protein IJX61_00655 [Ruminococcus sp.]|nr:hypothetical protein [Ruminococcus sp.]